MLEKTNTLTRKQRVNSFITEYNEIFDSISANDINKISYNYGILM